MRRSFAFLSMTFALSLVLASLGPAQAGRRAPVFNELDPDRGPSPNTVTVSGDRCSQEVVNRIDPQGISLLGGDPVYVGGDAFVQLFDKDNPSQPIGPLGGPYPASDNEEGTWSGPFQIIAGLEPGVYPAEARCDFFVNGPVSAAGLVLSGLNGGFEYPQVRSYTVVVPAEPPEPVESDVTFTG